VQVAGQRPRARCPTPPINSVICLYRDFGFTGHNEFADKTGRTGFRFSLYLAVIPSRSITSVEVDTSLRLPWCTATLSAASKNALECFDGTDVRAGTRLHAQPCQCRCARDQCSSAGSTTPKS
jgi:hypothetical protein